MRFTATLKFLGIDKKEFNKTEYTLINLLDLSTTKIFTLFIDKDMLENLKVFKPYDDITCCLELSKRIQDNKEVPTLSLLEVQNVGKVKA